jgi:hypothetical protein
MLPVLEVKKSMNTIKQFGKGDYVHQRPLGITQLFKNNSSINVIKGVFYIDLHHCPIRV